MLPLAVVARLALTGALNDEPVTFEKSTTAPDRVLSVAPEPMVIVAAVLVPVVSAENAKLLDPEHDPQVQLPAPDAVDMKHWPVPVGPGMPEPPPPPPPPPPCWARTDMDIEANRTAIIAGLSSLRKSIVIT